MPGPRSRFQESVCHHVTHPAFLPSGSGITYVRLNKLAAQHPTLYRIMEGISGSHRQTSNTLGVCDVAEGRHQGESAKIHTESIV